MTAPPFAHLHCHSHYSLLDGAGDVGRLLERAKALRMNALALTDHGNLHGSLEFYQKAKALGINPILGYEAYIAPASRWERDAANMKEASYHLTLLARNRTGFQNLLKLASAAYLEGFYFRPRIDKEILEAHNEGLICLSGCLSSELSRSLLAGSDAERRHAEEVAEWFARVFGERYFIELQDNGLEEQRLVMEGAVELARQKGFPVVATSDVHYVNAEDADAQDILLCVNTGKFRTDQNRMKMDTQEFYLRSPEEMYEAFAGHEDALEASQQIADSVDIELELGRRHFPVFTPPEGRASEDYLRELCLAGLEDRYKDKPGRCSGGELSQEVLDRLDRELGVINKLGFPNYFLIVWDFVHFAREQGIEATARGSGVGSLVAYALYLSHVCPLEYDLLFERFLDVNRLEAPDIDIDFDQQRRGEVIQYVKDKYGTDNVCQIGTFGTMAARAAIRDVGRALGLPIPRVNDVVAKVPDQLGITLPKALQKSDDLKKAYDTDPEVRELLDFAMKIEGLARNVGTHAAAVVIADRPLTEYVPLCRVQNKEEVITQWAMADVEAAGLLKMDFLGLRNLTILSRVVKLIEETTGERVDPYRFPLGDAETFALLCRGETKGIFQLESGGIRDLLQRMKPDHFRDIIATNALYRPGPLEGGMVDDYIAVKHGRKEAEYKHPVMKDILEETHGVMVYQEQVMRILNRLGGIELADAYKCIKAISKKKLPIIAKFKEQFVEGAHANGLSKREAEELFGLIEKFAGYGFNKCVVGETTVIDAESGERATVEELFRTGRPFVVHSLDDNWKLRPRRVIDVVWNGRKRVYKLMTRQGKTIVATANHPIRTLNGWTNLGDLEPGDRVAAPRRLHVGGGNAWPRHEVIALAGLLSEGNTCHPTCLYYYNDDPALIDDFVEAAECFPQSVARVSARADGRRKEVCVSTGRDTRFQSGQTPWNAGQPEETATAVATEAPVRSGMYRWAEKLGILNRRATEKRIPGECFGLDDADVELFLGRLWSGDGFVGSPGQMPFYATSSAGLARDVQTLLLRLGILSGVHHKTFDYKHRGRSEERSGYTVHLVGDESVRAFVERVALHALGREEQFEQYRTYLGSVQPGLTSKDTIPAEIRTWVNEERKAAGLGWRELEAQSGVSTRDLCRRSAGSKRGFRRSTVTRLAEFFGSQRLRQAADSDIFWDTVDSIQPQGVHDTYDLTVEKNHNFVADGLIVHNSHSTAYALIAYMTAYLKAHWPVEFMAALLSSDMPNRNFTRKDSTVEHLEDCQRMEIEVVPPDVNRSEADYAVRDGKILFGLAAMKGCGTSAAEAIAAERRKDGPFKSLFDFTERVDPGAVNRSAIETLVKAGAFDSLGVRRAQVFAAIDRALQSGASKAADRRSGQKGLFDDHEDDARETPDANLPDVPEWEERDMLNKEKEVLGFYLSSHPLAEHADMLATYCSHTTQEAAALKHRTEVMLGGMISSIKLAHTKNPRPGNPSKYAMFDLEDTAGIMRCIVWPEQFVQFGDLVQPDAILVALGAVDKRAGSDEANLIVNELLTLDQLEGRYTRGVIIRVMEEPHGQQGLEQLYEVLRGYPGKCQLQLVVCLADGTRVPMACDRMRVDVNPEMRSRVDGLLGPGNFKLQTASARGGGNGRGSGRGNGRSARR